MMKGISPQFRPRERRMNLPAVLLRATLGISVVALLVQGCAQNPVSGRQEVALVSVEKEREIGAELASQIKEAVGLVEDQEPVTYVRAIGSRLAQHSPRRDVEYMFNVIDMVEPNAFALPGGYIYVSRGLLPLVNSEDELVGVIAHEIAHVAARHAVQRVNVSVATAPVRIATGITGLATGIVAPRLGRMVAGVGQVATGLVLAPYSRDQEREADRIGQEIAASAGWDPKGITTFLETLGREEALRSEGPRRISFFNTHPSTPDRVTRTTRHATDITPSVAEPIARDRADLLAQFDGLLVGKSPSEGVFIENQFLQPDLDFTLRFPLKWDTLNARNLVAAKAPGEDVIVLVQLVGEGEDPLEIARAIEKQAKAKILKNAQSTLINGLRAVRTAAVVRGSKGKMGLDLTWIAHRKLVYQITAASPLKRFNSFRKDFIEIAESFRPLLAAERSEIREARLRVVRAQDGENLEQLLGRTDRLWTPAEAAVANAIEPDIQLREGQLIKVPIRQVYASPWRSERPAD
jgi:predicted Zn-dependent protease